MTGRAADTRLLSISFPRSRYSPMAVSSISGGQLAVARRVMNEVVDCGPGMRVLDLGAARAQSSSSRVSSGEVGPDLWSARENPQRIATTGRGPRAAVQAMRAR